MSFDSVIPVINPYRVLSPSDLRCPSALMEMDYLYHLRTSFLEYNKVAYFEPEWNLKYLSEEFYMLSINLDSIDDCFERSIECSDNIHFIFLWNVVPQTIPYMPPIFEKINNYRQKYPEKTIQIISLVADAWPRPDNIVRILEEHVKVSDRTLVCYESAIPMLLKNGREDIANKLTYMPMIYPFVFNSKAYDEKSSDFCYMGRVGGSFYTNRQRALDKLKEAFPEKTFFIRAGNKESKEEDFLSGMKEYIEKMGESQYSLLTSTCPENDIRNLANRYPLYEKDDFKWSSVFPGRFLESIVSLTVPIYVQFSDNDRLPKYFDGMECWIYIHINDSVETIRQKIESAPLDKLRENMLKLYNKFVSPEAVIPIMLGKKDEF